MHKKHITFTVSSGALFKKISSVSSIIATNPIMPILENFLFEITPQQLKITASDIQTTLSTQMSVDINSQAKIAVPARMLLDTLKNISEQPITLHIDEESYRMTIHAHQGNYKLAGENPTDFPEDIVLDLAETHHIPTAVFQKALSYTQVAISNDELKPALNGMYITRQQSEIMFVAIDGHKLVQYIYTGMQANGSIDAMILSKKVCHLIHSLIAKSTKENIAMQCNQKYAALAVDDVSIITQLIHEQYPDYANVIPQTSTIQCIVGKHDLLGALKRIGIYANKSTHQMKMVIEKNKINITAEDLDFFNEAHEEIVCKHEGDAITIGFNVKFFIQMLQVVPYETLTIKMIDPSKATLILPTTQAEEETLLLLIMPIILQ